ncbi:3-deoxy-8-phosphooctulonate synthase [Bacteroidetes bacterium endosymbiont of Geopemphigus sp.]|uniref:3-deoxy-8-phosphooctulonate synthase n=1 Tax=Bacteroidetes bacterium endosymbiont of Geopemphigus sp. TaxID=2047937 RepID=UPI000CD21F8C|nr:3-deoxy-8-phosphooctulonate synthase [Bacteroidetes bacterium endosymbiont of Geopemphigus sp.]
MIQTLSKIKHIDADNFFLIAGPCVIESEGMALHIAEGIARSSEHYKIPYIFKGSFKKANRSRLDSFSGIGDEKALKILRKVGEIFDIPVTTDIHLPSDAIRVADYVDVLQIPAFLVRQTDLLVAAAQTQRAVTLKKGQFLSPESMRFVVEKMRDSGSNRLALIERGTTFGYQDLVVDYRSIPIMQEYAPVILDVTHSLQKPNQGSGITGGHPQWIETLAKAGIVTGVNGIFIETHPYPHKAKSDGANMLPLDLLDPLLKKLIVLRKAIKVFSDKKDQLK